MLRFRRVATAAVVVSVLAFASTSPAIADSKNESTRNANKCAQVASKQDKFQRKIDQLSSRPTSSDPDVQASRRAKLAKLQNRLARAADGC